MCSKKAGILAALVVESPGALPSYIKRSLASSQNFLSKYLSVVFIPRGSIIQLMVAFLSLSREGEARKPNSRHTREFDPTWICSSLEMSALIVRRAASPLNLKKGSRTKKMARSATRALVIVWSGWLIHASLSNKASFSAFSSAPRAYVYQPRARSCLSSSLTLSSNSFLAFSGTAFSRPSE